MNDFNAKDIAITKTRNDSISFIFFLVSLLVFHFHPTNIVNGGEQSVVNNQQDGLSGSHQKLHCEICHLLSTFNYIPASDFTITEISLISFDEFNFQSTPLQRLSFSSNLLRAPPTV